MLTVMQQPSSVATPAVMERGSMSFKAVDLRGVRSKGVQQQWQAQDMEVHQSNVWGQAVLEGRGAVLWAG